MESRVINQCAKNVLKFLYTHKELPMYSWEISANIGESSEEITEALNRLQVNGLVMKPSEELFWITDDGVNYFESRQF